MEELDIKQIVQAIWNKKLIVIIVTAITMTIAAVYSYALQKPKYQSFTTIVLTKSAQETEEGTISSLTSTDVTMNQKLVETYSEIIKSESVLEEVLENTGIDNITPGKLKSNITVKAVKDTEVIKVTVTSYDAEDAAKIANEIGVVFAKWVKQNLNLNNVHTLDKAKVATSPYNIQPVKYIAIAAVIGIIISCAYIVIRELFDTTVKTADEIESLLDIPVIAQISNASIYYAKGGKSNDR